MEYENSDKIGGPHFIVQIDESNLCHRKYHVGRELKSENFWVFGGIDEFNHVFLERVLRRDKETLSEVLNRRVKEGSIIFSDSWRGYCIVSEYFEHHQVNHSTNFVNPIDHSNTQKIEATWSVLKRVLRMKGSRKCFDLNLYLAEFMWKSVNKQSIFFNFLSLMKKHFNPQETTKK